MASQIKCLCIQSIFNRILNVEECLTLKIKINYEIDLVGDSR